MDAKLPVVSCQLPVQRKLRAFSGNWQLATGNSSRNFRKGFSFTEVLFAVIVLGIGFIMVAAMFPVAIQQRQLTVDETAAANIVRGAVSVIKQIADDTNMPSTDPDGVGPLTSEVWSFVPNDEDSLPSTANADQRWAAMKGEVILQFDPRYAWVALYRRDADAAGNPLPYAQIYIVVVQARNKSQFTAEDVENDFSDNDDIVPIQSHLINVEVGDSLEGDWVGFDSSPPEFDFKAAAEGAYVIIADGPQAGRILRVGGRRIDLDTATQQRWELIPGSDTDASFTAAAYIIGKPIVMSVPMPVPLEYEGPAMPISIYTTFVQVN